MVLERLSWCVTCLNHVSFYLLTIAWWFSCRPTRNWSCSTPSHWSCVSSGRCREISSGTWSQSLDPLLSQQVGSVANSYSHRSYKWTLTKLLLYLYVCRLVSGDVKGKLTHLYNRVNKVIKTSGKFDVSITLLLSLIHIWRCRRADTCRSRWSPYH